jgi:hypothetical protein
MSRIRNWLTANWVQLALFLTIGLAFALLGDHHTLAATPLLMGVTLPRAGAVTLLDFAKSIDPNGSTARVIELLNQTNSILDDMLWVEGNLPTGHRTTVRTGLPTAVWRQLYQGVPASKSIRAQVDDACGMLETRSEVDKDLALLNGNTTQFRLSEGLAFVEGMNQAMAQTLFYGNTSVNPERFTGLAPRYSDSTALNGQNIIKMGGSANANTSIWLVVWDQNTCHGIYPNGSEAGLIHQDLGEIDAFDTSTPPARYRAFADRWQWKCGVSLRDWRYVVRVANIDAAALVADTAGASVKIIEAMIKAINRLPNQSMGKGVFYVNRTVRQMLMIQAMNKSTNALSLSEGAKQFEVNFLGVPIRLVDAILNTEANVP